MPALTLTPVPGFCVKTTTEEDGSSKPLKVFVNVGWDANVPPPTSGIELVARKIAEIPNQTNVGIEFDWDDPRSEWFLPCIASPARHDKDKASRPCLVFDAIYNPAFAPYCDDPASQGFKFFLIEHALHTITHYTQVPLTRALGFPNIKSKGKLAKRVVDAPFFASTSASTSTSPKSKSRNPLIQEIGEEKLESVNPGTDEKKTRLKTPEWRITDSGEIRIKLPELTHAYIPQTTLLLRTSPPTPTLTLHVPGLYDLQASLPRDPKALEEVRAEWRVGEGELVVFL